MRRLALALLLPAAACGMVLGPEPSTRPLDLYESFWQEFDRHYAFFELKGVDWRAAGDAHRPPENATDAQLFIALADLVDELNDPHVVVRTPHTRYQSGFGLASRETRFNEELVNRALRFEWKSTPDNRIKYGKLTADIGYLRIPGFGGGGWGPDVEIPLRELSITSLVIDIRDNGGGDNAIALEVAGRFADARRLAAWFRYRNGPRHSDFTDYIPHHVEPRGDVRFTGPVVVLTNRRVASAAEDFLLLMRALPHVTVVGDTTMGASGNPLMRELANGWTYQLSEWIEYTPERVAFEGAGLAPHVAVQITGEDVLASNDPQLNRAVQLLLASPLAAPPSD